MEIPDYNTAPIPAQSSECIAHCRSFNDGLPICRNSWKQKHAFHPTTNYTRLFMPVLRCGCCCRFSAVVRIQPRHEDRCAKLPMRHLRDLQALLAISRIGTPTNFRGVETKNAGRMSELSRFMIPCDFDLSFVGRKSARGRLREREIIRAENRSRMGRK